MGSEKGNGRRTNERYYFPIGTYPQSRKPTRSSQVLGSYIYPIISPAHSFIVFSTFPCSKYHKVCPTISSIALHCTTLIPSNLSSTLKRSYRLSSNKRHLIIRPWTSSELSERLA